LTALLDEAHILRNRGQSYFGWLRIADNAYAVLIASATPLHTAPKVSSNYIEDGLLIMSQDVLNCGRMARIQAFMTEESAIEETEDVKALAKIKRDLNKRHGPSERDDAALLLTGQTRGGSDPYMELRSASINAVVKYRDQFGGRIIRRMPESKDLDGQTISGLHPYQTTVIWVRLHERERSAIEAQVRDMTSK
jgi:hypothetical protein